MAFTTLAALRESIMDMDVAGVKTKRNHRPRQVAATSLPLMFPRLPSRSRETSTLGYGQDLRRATIEVVIFVEMIQLSTQRANDELAVELIDALGDALEENAEELGLDSYEITTDEDTIGDGATPVQAIIATVEVSG